MGSDACVQMTTIPRMTNGLIGRERRSRRMIMKLWLRELMLRVGTGQEADGEHEKGCLDTVTALGDDTHTL